MTNWVWMPHPGHFICAHRCRFHLNTYVNGYIISTVGELVLDSAVMDILRPELKKYKGEEKERKFIEGGFDTIGHNRTYETMVFKARKISERSCCPYRIVSGYEIEMRGYNDPIEAYEGHMALCWKYEKEA